MRALFLAGWSAGLALGLAACRAETPTAPAGPPPRTSGAPAWVGPSAATEPAVQSGRRALATAPSLGPPRPTGSPAPGELRVNPYLRHQTLDGIGANSFVHPISGDMDWDWDAVRFVFDEIPLAYLRVAPWFIWWEPENDDSDPSRVNWEGFQTVHPIPDRYVIPFAEHVSGYGLHIEPGVFDVPEWMSSSAERPWVVSEAMRPELAESISSFHAYLRAHDVRPPVIEVANEPDLDQVVYYPSKEALVQTFAATLDRLDQLGMAQMKVHGPNTKDAVNAAAWGDALLSHPRVGPRMGALSYHTWWISDPEPYRAIRRVAEKHGVPVWATEVGYCALPEGCFEGTHFLRPDTWATALDYAVSYWRAIELSRASRVYHWALLGSDAVVSKQGDRTPSFHVLRQFARFIPPGAVLIDSKWTEDTLLTLAFLRPDGSRSVILVNRGDASAHVRLTDLATAHPRVSEALTSSEGRYEVQTVRRDDGAFEIPPLSVSSLAYEAAAK